MNPNGIQMNPNDNPSNKTSVYINFPFFYLSIIKKNPKIIRIYEVYTLKEFASCRDQVSEAILKKKYIPVVKSLEILRTGGSSPTCVLLNLLKTIVRGIVRSFLS